MDQDIKQATPGTNGSRLIAIERQRQIKVEGWTPEHDSGHDRDELVDAARCYLRSAEATRYASNNISFDGGYRPDDGAPQPWPWAARFWKPTGDAVRDLVKAGALIAAEIDRIQRAVPQGEDPLPYVCTCDGTGWVAAGADWKQPCPQPDCPYRTKYTRLSGQEAQKQDAPNGADQEQTGQDPAGVPTRSIDELQGRIWNLERLFLLNDKSGPDATAQPDLHREYMSLLTGLANTHGGVGADV